jgi:uncharacterized protein YndB with AHSA1/START domain
MKGENKMLKTNLIAEPGKQEIIITHLFNAPRDMVFQVYTNPELIPQWWGPKRLTTRVEKMEIRPGGQWRFIQHDSDGKEYAFHGIYHEVTRPERVISTFEFEGIPSHVLLETVTFKEKDGKTEMVDTLVFQSVKDRDGMLQTGMEEGSSESMERFTELLAKVFEGVSNPWEK